jgi:hypothetical protein
MEADEIRQSARARRKGKELFPVKEILSRMDASVLALEMS